MERREVFEILTIPKPARFVGLIIALAMIVRPPYFVPKDYQGYSSSAGYPMWVWDAQKGVVVDYRMLVIQLALLFVFVVACGNRRKKD